jgi:uncharacterized protein (DUF952 family)/2'-5' RNA ligase
MVIYHIAFRADWADAVAAGEYRVSTRGRSLEQEGFIHGSTAGQVAGVANAFYADAEDLFVLVIDPERLTAPLRYDPVPGAAEPFPHVYGPLNIEAVTGTAELGRDADGRYVFEPDVPEEFRHAAGDTLLLVALPDLDAVVAPWALPVSDGIDAHVTVLTPFLPEARVDEPVLAELRRIFAAHRGFELNFARTSRFPNVLYLVPEPDQPLRALTAAVHERWPECPPYGGEYPDPKPHLTVVFGKDEAEYETVRRDLEPRLPIRTRAEAVDLLGYDGARWNLRERFPLGD